MSERKVRAQSPSSILEIIVADPEKRNLGIRLKRDLKKTESASDGRSDSRNASFVSVSIALTENY